MMVYYQSSHERLKTKQEWTLKSKQYKDNHNSLKQFENMYFNTNKSEKMSKEKLI